MHFKPLRGSSQGQKLNSPTCLCTLGVPVCKSDNKSCNNTACCATYALPTLDPLKASTMESNSKQYASETDVWSSLDSSDGLGGVALVVRVISHSSFILVVSLRMAWTMCEQT